jgi:cytochrome P450
MNKQYGDTVLVFLHGWTPRINIFVYDPKVVKYFLQDNFKNYIRESDNPRFNTLFGLGIFNANGAQWKKQRQTARPLFTPNSLQLVQPIIVNRATQVLDILNGIAKEKKEVDIQDIFMRFTLDAIGEMGFGYNIGSLDKPVPFSTAFDRAQQIVNNNFDNSLLRFFPDKEFDKCMKTMWDFTLEIIQQRRKETDLESRNDMLSRFLLAKDPETNQDLSDKYLSDILLNFFIAGRDTTAILLTWTFYLLSQNPDVETKLIEEIDTVLKGEAPSWENLKHLTYLQKVLDETLRLYPSVPIDGRTSVAEDVLPNGIHVPPHTMLLYSAWAMGRSEKYWDNPLKFDPDRWNEPPKEPLAFVPFHAGPQTCLGRPLAYQEAKTMVVLLLQKYTLRLVPGHKVEPKKAIVLPARYGMKMTVHPRH